MEHKKYKHILKFQELIKEVEEKLRILIRESLSKEIKICERIENICINTSNKKRFFISLYVQSYTHNSDIIEYYTIDTNDLNRERINIVDRLSQWVFESLDDPNKKCIISISAFSKLRIKEEDPNLFDEIKQMIKSSYPNLDPKLSDKDPYNLHKNYLTIYINI